MPRKRKRRRRRNILVRLLRPLAVILAAVAVVAALTLFFKVGDIEVTGNARYTAEEIAAATGVEPGDNLILLDRYGIQQRLFVDLPYIKEARINPKLPATLMIEVAETKALASLPGAGAYWLISRDGKILEAVDQERAQEYLDISGLEIDTPATGQQMRLVEDSHISLARLQELLSLLEERQMLSRTDSLDMTDPDKLAIGYDGRFRVEMYYSADFAFKLHCLEEAVGRLQPNETGIIRMTMKDENEVRFIPSG